MTKLLAVGVAIGVSFFSFTTAQSMPLAPLEQAHASLSSRRGAVDRAFTEGHKRLPSLLLLRRCVLWRRCGVNISCLWATSIVLNCLGLGVSRKRTRYGKWNDDLSIMIIAIDNNFPRVHVI